MNANPHDLSAHPDLGPIGARMRSEWGRSRTTPRLMREQFQRHQSSAIGSCDARGDRLASRW
jgi:hypothetical protein